MNTTWRRALVLGIVAAGAASTASAGSPMYVPSVPFEADIAGLVQVDRAIADVKALVGVGNRFGGSATNIKAAEYALAQMRAIGLDAALVPDTVPVWTYDLGEYGLKLVSAVPGSADEATRKALAFGAAYPYGFSTTVGNPSFELQAQVVYVGDGTKAELYRDAKGKIVLMDGNPKKGSKLATEAGAKAIITGYPNDKSMYADAAMVSSLTATDATRLPVMAVSFPEAAALRALIQAGVAPVVRFSVTQKVYQGAPVSAIGRIQPPGTSKFIIICAHADGDSGGPSADDNASGTAAVLEVARVMKSAMDKGLWKPSFGVQFMVLGKEYASVGSWLAANPGLHGDVLSVFNFDEVGTGASRDAIFFESPDVPYNELLLRTADSVGRDFVGKPGFWKEYATDDSLGGTDSYAFLSKNTARGNGRYAGTAKIPATTVFTAAWNKNDIIDQVPFWPNKGLAPGAQVIVDYSAYYHSSRDLPETTVEREPWNLSNGVISTLLSSLRLQGVLAQATPFADDATARFDANRLYAEELYGSSLWQLAGEVAGDPTSRPVANLSGTPLTSEIVEVATRSLGHAVVGSFDAGAPLTRLGFAKLMAAASGVTLPDAAATDAFLKGAELADEAGLAPQDRAFVARAMESGWLLANYDKDGNPVFEAAAPISRGEALKRLYWLLVWKA